LRARASLGAREPLRTPLPRRARQTLLPYLPTRAQSATEDLGSPDVLSSRPIAAADLVAGSRHFIEVPEPGPTKRYLGLQWVKAGAGAGLTYTAWLTSQSAFSEEAKIFPKASAV
jgi:hypothetical protein